MIYSAVKAAVIYCSNWIHIAAELY
jgi:hypothetical protein